MVAVYLISESATRGRDGVRVEYKEDEAELEGSRTVA